MNACSQSWVRNGLWLGVSIYKIILDGFGVRGSPMTSLYSFISRLNDFAISHNDFAIEYVSIFSLSYF